MFRLPSAAAAIAFMLEIRTAPLFQAALAWLLICRTVPMFTALTGRQDAILALYHP